jgi:hypothetical protein
MTTKCLFMLLHLLRLYRAALTWTTSTVSPGPDSPRPSRKGGRHFSTNRIGC